VVNKLSEKELEQMSELLKQSEEMALADNEEAKEGDEEGLDN